MGLITSMNYSVNIFFYGSPLLNTQHRPSPDTSNNNTTHHDTPRHNTSTTQHNHFGPQWTILRFFGYIFHRLGEKK